MGELFANGFKTHLTEPLAATDTQAQVADPVPAALAGPGTFRVKIGSELLAVTEVDGLTWTLARGADSGEQPEPAPADHAYGQTVTGEITAGALSNLAASSPVAAAGVQSVTAGDETVEIGGTATAPTVSVQAALFDAAGTAQDLVATEQTRAETEEQALNAALATEITRAQAVEVAETNRAQAAEQANSIAITNEVTRAKAAEVKIGLVQPNTVLLLGASIEQREGSDWPLAAPSSLATTFSSWSGSVTWANALLGGPLRIIKNAGAAGVLSTQQLANIQNPASAQYCTALSPAPGIVYLGHVTGDDGATVPPATSAANDLAIYQLLRQSYPNSLFILPTLPGVASNAGTRNAVNPQRRQIARTNPNTLLIDYEQVYTNPTTGLPVPSLSVDGTHPNPNGAYVLGKQLAAVLQDHVGSGSMVNDYTNDTRVLAANGGIGTDAMFTGTPGTNALGAGWTVGGTPPAGVTTSLTARNDQYGNWQTVTYNGTAGKVTLQHAGGSAAATAGKVIQAEGQLQFTGTMPAGQLVEATLVAQVYAPGFTSVLASGYAGGNSQGSGGYLNDPGAGVVATFKTQPLVVPSGAASVYVLWIVTNNGTTGSIALGRCSLLVNPT